MKRINIILAITLLMMAGCGGRKLNNQDGDFITVDVTRRYPQKELILQDFMDVEYIALETSREFLCQGVVQAIGNDFIIVTNRVRDGDIFIFDRNGKGLRKFNRQGNGTEEYSSISAIILDESSNEVFLHEATLRKMIVYDFDGKYKRSFIYAENRYINVYNYDSEYFICRDDNRQTFIIISKQDGSIVKNIEIPFLEVKNPSMTLTYGGRPIVAVPNINSIIPYRDNWILTEPSSDTIFMYLPDQSMIPFLVRTPSIQSMEPEIFLFPSILTDRYYFMESTKKEFNLETWQGFPNTNLMYDKQDKKIFEYLVYNDDFVYKKLMDFGYSALTDEIAFSIRLEADDLFDAYREGQLKGRLKEIAAGLKEEDNPVIMIVKHKR